jgi:tRNA nucleotidyltransferase (CCA-adding enzyme)
VKRTLPGGTRTSSDLELILREAERVVSPSAEERERLERVLGEALRRVKESVKRLNLDAEVVAVGSSVRDTWLPNNNELDIFVLFPKGIGDKEVLGGLIIDIAKDAFGEYEQNYAEHPYVRVRYSDFEIDLVPAFKILPGERIVSAVDRTPLHNSYVKEKLKRPNDVRLLKAFLKSIDAYGAEERVGGFSGYVCELLIINYGSFLKTIEEASKWGPRVYIDIEHHLTEEYAFSAFNGPLILIDPTDPRRNAAAALTETQFNRFKVAARAFLKNPDIEFFTRGLGGEKGRVSAKQIEEQLSERRTRVLIIEISDLDLPRELLWSQAKRMARLLEEELKANGFDPLWVSGWTDERNKIFVAMELPSLTLPTIERRQGPPVGSKEEINFLKSYLNSGFGGPFIEGDRWYVYRRRRHSDVINLINELMNLKVPTLLRGARFKTLTDRELLILDRDVLRWIYKEMRREEFFIRHLVG